MTLTRGTRAISYIPYMHFDCISLFHLLMRFDKTMESKMLQRDLLRYFFAQQLFGHVPTSKPYKPVSGCSMTQKTPCLFHMHAQRSDDHSK